MQKTYLFYDIETTGRNKCFDQILQFAAIRTNLELQELERYEIQIKLNCDVIPDPEAILIHGISIHDMQEGSLENEALLKIHALLNTRGTISCGYNTLGFDDEFLRFSFYRNLLPPYTHQWANDCGRMDLYPIAILYYLYKQDLLNWPLLNDKPSLKLEHLNQANQLAHGPSHNAMSDVEATLALARIFFKDQAMWKYVTGYFDKKIDVHRAHQLNLAFDTHHFGLMIGEAGSSDFYQFPVLSLGQHNHYKNQSLWLRLDKKDLLAANSENINKSTWVARKKAGEPGLLLPFSNRFTQHLHEDRLNITQENIQWLQKNPHLLQEIQNYHKEYTYPKIPNVDVNAALYDSRFLTHEEECLCQTFHAAKLEQKTTIVPRFLNPNLQKLATRMLGRHYAQHLTTDLAKYFHDYLSAVNPLDETQALVDFKGEKKLTPREAVNKILKLREERELNETQSNLITGLEQYLKQRFLAHIPLASISPLPHAVVGEG